MTAGAGRLRSDGRPLLTRSPVYVLTLVAGTLATIVGWIVATVLDQTLIAAHADVTSVLARLPSGLQSAPATATTLGAIAAVVIIHGWLVGERRFRRLALVEVALVTGALLSELVGRSLRDVLRPDVAAHFADIGAGLTRTLPTSPVVAAVIAALVMVRPWIPARSRSAAYLATALWLTANIAVVDAPPYFGLGLDVGLGLVAGSMVALVLRTPNLQPDRADIVDGLGAAGLDVTELQAAGVDARGSEPWIGRTADDRLVFVKALSTDQRAADLLFRAGRWLRLRRTGDAPPEVSLRRAAEHEALVAHHVRALGIATPRVLAVAEVGPNKVALVYEGIAGRSLDRVRSDAIGDEILTQVWARVADLRRHRIAHRDLRLANVFLGDDGEVVLIDFGFAELAASDQLLDTDVAELLAATAAVVGPRRAVDIALRCVGREVLEAARDWLHPLALSAATRRSIGAACGLDALRTEVNRSTGHTMTEYERLGRLTASRLVAVALLVTGLYTLVLLGDDGVIDAARETELGLLALAALVGTAVPILAALGYRAALGRRLSVIPAVRAALASEAPAAASTYWSVANRLLSDAARDRGVHAITAKRAAATWTVAGLLSAPLLVAGFSAAGLRPGHGEVSALLHGVWIGAGTAVAAIALLRFGPGARELTRVWINPYRDPHRPGRVDLGTLAWAAAARTAQGTAFALAARAAGVETSFESLVAIGIVATAVASLLPSPGGIGAVEVIAYFAVALDTPATVAVLAVALGRVATFWIHLPFAAAAYAAARRDTRHHSTNGTRRPAFGSFDPSAPQPVRGSWWT